MSTLTKQWLQQKIADMEATRDEIPFGLGEDGTNTLAALRIALASLEAEAVCVIDQSNLDYLNAGSDADVWPVSRTEMGDVLLYRTAPPAPANAEPVAWLWSHRKHPSEVSLVRPEDDEKAEGAHWSGWSCQALYAAPPAPVSVPAAMEMDDDFDSAFEHGKAVGWNACRAAMLNHSENERDMVERVSQSYKLPEEKGASLQLRNLIRKRHAEWSDSTFGNVGPIGPLKHLSKEALEAAAEPDDLSEWADMQFLLWDAQRRAGISDGEITAAMEEKLKVNMARQWPEPKDGEPRLHIKAAPQQEVTQALAKGMERYGDAMQKLADSGD